MRYTKPSLLSVFLGLLIYCLSINSHAQEARELGKPYEEFGEYKIFFSVFNSSFIPPEIAKAYELVRGSNRALVNIAVLKNGQIRGSKAAVSGEFKNLIQQTRELEFKEIKEQNAVYYLAPLRFDNEEVIHFNITVTPEGSEESHSFSFHRKMNTD
ncbi:DUF4426 domain-containing protein [Pseudoteredinibacter isoporae]|uniref:DUF4426 domain-containing protein n=1 Tax=Pseudoteredinibacter isoporae TaxID=570281 RepID=A0A7X0JPH6_9GAMM|nr:DUF4426 domain-containing protein [Pseudoteredinibacter isoporae]MBB6519905.1 hypothetical protein [Pseudoteredinibacter isoporae]NHO85483.1 DUF4426 domain-containing protein [Pseudoteredinibacter isoporae]NIB26065.1 DUF4426 domain-containing protein [Pseudoteredinibacter isoporae]